jgi:hypothetical protein
MKFKFSKSEGVTMRVTPIPMTPSRLHINYLLTLEEKNAKRLDV